MALVVGRGRHSADGRAVLRAAVEDAMSVAVLFLVELDNLAFSHGLREKMRVEAEEFGRISVTDDDSRLIDAIKLVCMLTVPAAILGGVPLGDNGEFFAFLPVLLVVMVQSVLCAPAGKCVGACWGLLRVLVGFFVAGCVMAVAVGTSNYS